MAGFVVTLSEELMNIIRVATAARDTKKIVPAELRFQRMRQLKNGQQEMVELVGDWVVFPLQDNEVGWVAKNVTEFCQMREQLELQKSELEKALQVKSRFLAVMSHGDL
jgi:hypothetical protein